MMRKNSARLRKLSVFILALVILGAAACNKTEDPFDHEAQFELEKPIIAEYVAEKIPGAIYDEDTGIWYEVIAAGEEGSYEYKFDTYSNQLILPIVTINYEGKLLNGTVFDSNNTANGLQYPLEGFIDAWKIVFIPEKIEEKSFIGLTANGLQKGAIIRFVTPSFWAYADKPNGAIPANSPLDFTIRVLDLK